MNGKVISNPDEIDIVLDPEIVPQMIGKDNKLMRCYYALRISHASVKVTEQLKRRREHFRDRIQRKDVKNKRRPNDLRFLVFQKLARLNMEGRVMIGYHAQDVDFL